MNDIEKAAGAKRIKDDEAFKDIIEAIKEAKTSVFLDPHSTKEQRESAHVIICAIGEIEGEIESRLTDGAFAEKDQHRVND